MEIALRRLHQQHIASNTFKTPVDVVQWMGAVQAQDYLGSLWAIGLRMQHATQNGVERAIAGRTIIRTWPLRGTLHFVAAADVRWMLALLTPRFIAKSRSRFKQLDLDERVLACCKELFVNALSGGRQLSRESMHNVLEAARISAANSRGLHILGRLAQEAIICFGPRQGKQQTFVLLEEWVPAAKKMERNEALAELAARYFTSHGPATLHDFAWWSGLTMSDAIAGLGMAKRTLEQEAIGTQAFWFCPPALQSIAREREAYLLPAYDEFTVAYRDRSAVLAPVHAMRSDSGNGIFSPTIVINGQVVGTWKRTLRKGSVVITPNLFTSVKKAVRLSLSEAARRYGDFLELPTLLA